MLNLMIPIKADWNHLNKIVVSPTMLYAETAEYIDPEQYRSSKKKIAILLVTNNPILLDIVMQPDAALMVSVEKSCCDRISISIASLSLQRL
jgi:hypothetical protein